MKSGSGTIDRRIGFGKKIVLGDKSVKNCETIAKTMVDAGFDVEPFEMDLSSRESILAMTPAEELLSLDMLKPENIRDTLHAYQMAKRWNEKRMMYESVRWGKRGARLNDIAPGIIVTPLAIDEFNGPRGDFYKNMFAKCPARRPGTSDEMANMAELLMSDAGATAS